MFELHGINSSFRMVSGSRFAMTADTDTIGIIKYKIQNFAFLNKYGWLPQELLLARALCI